MQMRNTNVDESRNSWIIQLVGQKSGEHNPAGVMRNPNNGSPSQLLELGMEWMIDQGDSWMNTMSYEDWVSRMVSTINLFFLTFWEKNLRTLQFIATCCSHLSEWRSTCFHGSHCTFWCATRDGIYASRTGTDWSQLGDPHDNLSTWTCVDTARLFLSRDEEDWSFRSLCNTMQIDGGSRSCEGHCTWHIWLPGYGMTVLHVPTSSSSCI